MNKSHSDESVVFRGISRVQVNQLCSDQCLMGYVELVFIRVLMKSVIVSVCLSSVNLHSISNANDCVTDSAVRSSCQYDECF